MTIDNIFNEIRKSWIDKKTRIIAIDGYGGSGKSMLADELISRDSAISVVHFDDFYKPDNNCDPYPRLPKFDWQRLEKQVLKPLHKNINSKYQRFNWHTEKLDDWINISIGGIIIIEGVYTMNSKLLKYYDYKIWVDCPLETRLIRAKERDGGIMMDKWLNEWIPAEDNYIKIEKPYLSADLVIDGSGLYADIAKGEIFVLDARIIELQK